MIREANEQAHAILREAKEYADQTIKQFQKYEKESPAIRKMEADRQKLRSRMKKAEEKMAMKQSPSGGTVKASDLHIGDTVKIVSMNLKGTVSTLPDKPRNLFVQAGIMRLKTSVSDLMLVDEPVISGPGLKRTSSGKVKMGKSASVSTEINLLGKTVTKPSPNWISIWTTPIWLTFPVCDRPRKRHRRTPKGNP